MFAVCFFFADLSENYTDADDLQSPCKTPTQFSRNSHPQTTFAWFFHGCPILVGCFST